MMKIRHYIAMLAAGLLLPFFLSGCGKSGGTVINNTVPRTSIPPIDVLATTETQTATFALG
ncbi:MAG: hypothetical protein A2144_13780 [Chloroflexi bacterium RBG_16_50_9]|nr:MAG: hypothetical protein A2144_13780 [Chloroflexi bacterium RBG_16_50_9]